jgi:hypothetical protein
LKQQLNSDNQNKHPVPFQVIDAVRLKMRVKVTNEETEGEKWVWKESRTVCLIFRTKELPPHVEFRNMKTVKFLRLLQQYDDVTNVGYLVT